MARREVRLSDSFLARASDLYPSGGSVKGQPSLEVFKTEALPVAVRAFADSWGQLSYHDISIRVLVTAIPPFFGAIAFFGVLVGDHVELVDLEEDPDYWLRLNGSSAISGKYLIRKLPMKVMVLPSGSVTVPSCPPLLTG